MAPRWQALIDEVKSLQRSDPQSKQMWWDYCSQKLGGVRDPSRHSPDVLEDFLSQVGQGAAASPAPMRRPSMGMGGGGKGPSWGGMPAMMGGRGGGMLAFMGPQAAGGDLVGLVKSGQRASAHWKEAWQMYCQLYGTGMSDPAKYDAEFISGFLDYAGKLGERVLVIAVNQSGIVQQPMMMCNGSKGGPPAGMKRQATVGSYDGPPTKRQATVGSYDGPPTKRQAPIGSYDGPPTKKAAAATDGDDEKAALVDQVKTLQRQDVSTKELWCKFCDHNLGGVRDPNRHDKEVLQTFLAGVSEP